MGGKIEEGVGWKEKIGGKGRLRYGVRHSEGSSVCITAWVRERGTNIQESVSVVLYKLD